MAITTLGVINLDEYRELFIDETAYRTFLARMEEALKFDLRAIVADHKVFGASLSPERAKDLLTEKFVKRLVQNPDCLTELARRIEHDRIVD